MNNPERRKFEDALGKENAIFGEEVARRYHWNTSSFERKITAVLQPVSVEEVCAIVRIASAHDIPLYPISTGNNWGYGAAQPVRDNNVIVDLGRMNRIHEVNRELAYAVVEPGVTQQQLHQHLDRNQIPLWLNPTGAGPSCSILGNTLERGFSIGPNGDHFLAQCGMEVVLASGQILKTGFGHYEGAKATHLYKWGVGPYLDGLFTQSNFGIVTKLGVWLMPEPEHFEVCYFTSNSESQLEPLVDAVRQLLFAGVFTGPINILHRNRLLIMLSRYPWNEMEGQTPLSETVAAQLARERKIGIWNGVGAICGSRLQVQAAKKTIRQIFRSTVDRLTFLSDAKLELMQRHPQLLSWILGMNIPEMLGALKSSYGMLKGIPSEVALPLAYWRNRRTPMPAAGMNPARDGCGIMWSAPVIPMTGRDARHFREIILPIFARYGLEACMTLTAVNQRCFDCTLPLLYDRDNPAEVENAHLCYQELHQVCKEHGYVPYRLGLQSMSEETESSDPFWDVVQQLKGALDPQGILAPGRYCR